MEIDQQKQSVLKAESGMTLVEVLMALTIFSLVSLSLYTLIQLGVQLVRDDQSRLDALAIAESQIESIKNVPYESIGTVNGIPQGAFEQNSTSIRNNITYTINTDIRYIDDPFDGLTPEDPVNTDYKKIRVSVSWGGQLLSDPVTVITTIVPEGVETSTGGGTVWIEVYNANAEPVINSTVRVQNDTLNPPINITSATDGNGRYILPGAPVATESYKIVVSKNGYSEAQTYSVDPITNPNPNPNDLSVTEGNTTTKVFTIDQTSGLTLQFQDRITGLPNSNLPVQLSGSKRIGTDLEGADILKYSEALTTDSNGILTVTGLEFDTYALTIDDTVTGIDFAGSAPHLPYTLAPNFSETITVHTFADADYTALLTVENESQLPIPNASVRMYTTSLSTDLIENTNSAGQAFFTPLSNGEFTIEITAEGFADYTGIIDIQEDELQTIFLTPL